MWNLLVYFRTFFVYHPRVSSMCVRMSYICPNVFVYTWLLIRNKMTRCRIWWKFHFLCRFPRNTTKIEWVGSIRIPGHCFFLPELASLFMFVTLWMSLCNLACFYLSLYVPCMHVTKCMCMYTSLFVCVYTHMYACISFQRVCHIRWYYFIFSSFTSTHGCKYLFIRE